MAVYEYIAKDESGRKFSGMCDSSDSIALLRKDLAKMGDTLLKTRRMRSKTPRQARITQDQIVTFTYKLAGMCSAGLSIVRCLETLEEQCENLSLKSVISDIRQNIATGSTLKDAFEKHRNIFPGLSICLSARRHPL